MYPEGSISNDTAMGCGTQYYVKAVAFRESLRSSQEVYPASSAVSQTVLLASERDVKKCNSFLIELYVLQIFHVEKFCDYLSPKKPHGVTLSGGIHQTLLMGYTVGLILRVSSHGADM